MHLGEILEILAKRSINGDYGASMCMDALAHYIHNEATSYINVDDIDSMNEYKRLKNCADYVYAARYQVYTARNKRNRS